MSVVRSSSVSSASTNVSEPRSAVPPMIARPRSSFPELPDHSRVTHTKAHDLPFATYRPRLEPAAGQETMLIALGLRPAVDAAASNATTQNTYRGAGAVAFEAAAAPEASFLEPICSASRYSPDRIYTSYFKTEENMGAFGYHHR